MTTKQKILLVIFWFLVAISLVSIPAIYVLVSNAKARFLQEEKPVKISMVSVTYQTIKQTEIDSYWGDQGVREVNRGKVYLCLVRKGPWE